MPAPSSSPHPFRPSTSAARLLAPSVWAGIAFLTIPPRTWSTPGPDQGPLYSLAIADLAEEERRLERVMQLSHADLERWNPALADFCHVGCPSCGEGKACGSDILDWNPGSPFEIRCRNCGEMFPSAKFPCASETRVLAPDGTLQKYPYCRGADGWPHYMEGFLLNRRRGWLRGMAQRLGATYRATGRAEYAEQAKAILLSFASVYDRLPIHGYSGKDFRPTFFAVTPEKGAGLGVRKIRGPLYDDLPGGFEAYPKWSVRQGSHWYYREIPDDLVLAYDQIKPVVAPSEREQIERFIRGTVNFTRTFRFTQDNMAALLARREILAGRVIGEPEFVRGGVQRLELLLKGRFYADGMWCEAAPSYFDQVYRGLGASMQALAGNGGPAGEAGGAGGLEDALQGTDAGFDRVSRSLLAMRRPDGGLATVYDTWSKSPKSGSAWGPGIPVPVNLPSTLLWASGHALLAHQGQDGEPVQARLHFAGKHGSHFHLDNLGLQIYALGREPCSDFGYTRTRMRPYARTTVAHNTVVVDDQPQADWNRSSMGGQVEVFEDEGPIRFVSVNSPGSYPQTRTYRRSLALVPAGKAAYLLDLFEVEGGRTHEWFLHGDADRDESLVLREALPRLEGQVLSDGKPFSLWDTPYGNQENVRLDHRISRRLLRQDARYRLVEGRASVTFATDSSEGGALHTSLFTQPGGELVLGAMPSLRRAQEVNGATRDYQTPLLVLRRQAGAGTLCSRFVAIHQPMPGTAEPFQVSGDLSRITVRGDGFTDFHLLGDRDSEQVSFRGRYGFVRLGRDGEVIASALIDGTLLSVVGDRSVLPAAASGNVLEVRGRQVKLDRPVDLAQASRVYLTLPEGEGYALELAGSSASPTNVLTLREAPGFEFQGKRGAFTSFPRKEIQGAIRFAVRYSVHQERESRPVPGRTPAAVATRF